MMANQLFFCLEKNYSFWKYIVLIILQNDPIRLGKGQFGCPFCNRTMIHLESMKRHIMIHTGEKPFSCEFEYCAYASNQKSHLKKHMDKHHAGNYF